MVNIIWVMMALIGFIFAAINGTIEEVNKAIFQGGKEAVTICIGLVSILVFWLGLMNIAKQSGLLELMTKWFSPIITKLFPEIPKNHPSTAYIVSNMTANLFGLGNAATPMGIKAMEELKKLNGNKDEASRSMITFLALNTSAITLVPTTVIGLRLTYESSDPTSIIIPTILAQSISLLGALMIDSYYHKKRMRRKK